MINSKVPTQQSRHIDIQYYAIQNWKDAGDIVMQHIPGVINPVDDLTKPLGWILHVRHARCIIGHFQPLYANAFTIILLWTISYDWGRVLNNVRTLSDRCRMERQTVVPKIKGKLSHSF
mgnify:CR=1 FL=1